MMPASIEDLRKVTMLGLVVSGWVLTLVLVTLSISVGDYAWPAVGLAILSNAVPTWKVLQSRTGARARLWCGLMTGMLPTLLLYGLQGTMWQTEALLLVAGVLVALTALCDHRPILLATAIFVVQHVVLVSFAPHWLGYTDWNLGLSAIRLFSIIGGGILLSLISVIMTRGFEDSTRLQSAVAGLSQELEDSRALSKDASHQLEAARSEKEEAIRIAVKQRRKEYQEVAQTFETTMNAVTQTVSNTALLLERSAHQLKLNADQTVSEARHVVTSAETANRAANTVAAGIAELSMSIAEVADNAGAQSILSEEATQSSGGGGRAISKLTDQSKTIGEATRSIVRIAERTNLLALNAAIEAASAGASGRGFSIVAHEVKALASQASDAATRIEAFLGGVRSGTLEAEENFRAIDLAIGQLGQNANTIRYDIENQRQSADTIENFARAAAQDSDRMVDKSRALAGHASEVEQLSNELDQAAIDLSDGMRELERAKDNFRETLKRA